jgi:hypothetical protein
VPQVSREALVGCWKQSVFVNGFVEAVMDRARIE